MDGLGFGRYAGQVIGGSSETMASADFAKVPTMRASAFGATLRITTAQSVCDIGNAPGMKKPPEGGRWPGVNAADKVEQKRRFGWNGAAGLNRLAFLLALPS